MHLADGDWLTDCGLGAASLTGAIPLVFDRELPTPHEPRRLTNEGGRLFHQMKSGDEWTDLCEFTLDEMHPIDCEVANWWTSTNPASKFTQDVAIGLACANGTRKAIRGGTFTHRRGAEVRHQRAVENAADLLACLDEHFALRFSPGTRFGPVGAAWAQRTSLALDADRAAQTVGLDRHDDEPDSVCEQSLHELTDLCEGDVFVAFEEQADHAHKLSGSPRRDRTENHLDSGGAKRHAPLGKFRIDRPDARSASTVRARGSAGGIFSRYPRGGGGSRPSLSSIKSNDVTCARCSAPASFFKPCR